MSAEAKDTGGLSPAQDAGEGRRKSGRKDYRFFMEDSYQSFFMIVRMFFPSS